MEKAAGDARMDLEVSCFVNEFVTLLHYNIEVTHDLLLLIKVTERYSLKSKSCLKHPCQKLKQPKLILGFS